MKTITRRSFLKSSAFAASALAWPVHSWSQIAGANGDLRVAVVGFNGQGKSHIEGFRKMEGFRVVVFCDADKEVLERKKKKLKERKQPFDPYPDTQKLLEKKNIDAISTATPN